MGRAWGKWGGSGGRALWPPGIEYGCAQPEVGAVIAGAEGQVVCAGGGEKEEIGRGMADSDGASPGQDAPPFQNDVFGNRQDPTREPGPQDLVEPDPDFGPGPGVAPMLC